MALSQDDFRKALTTGGGKGGGLGGGGKVDRASLLKAMSKEQRIKHQKRMQQRGEDEEEDVSDEEGTGPRNKRHKGVEPVVEEQPTTKEQQDEQKYRDRAEERRKGVNPDYDDEIAKLIDIDVEKTKYLGGDLKHTHLVKGLDYALLQKVRAELAEKQEEDRKEMKEEDETTQAGTQAEKARKRKSMEAVQTRTLLGKGIKFFLAQTYSTEVKPLDMFRTSALEYTVDPEEKRENLPTLISRSKVELEAQEDGGPQMLFRMPDVLLKRLKQTLTEHRQATAGKKKHKKRKISSTLDQVPSKKPVLAVDDIFGTGSGGGGKSTVAAKDQGAKKTVGVKKGAYFAGVTAKSLEEEKKGGDIDATVEAILKDAGLSRKEDSAAAADGGGGNRKARRAAMRQGGAPPPSAIPDLFGASESRKPVPDGIALGGVGSDDYGLDTENGVIFYESDEDVKGKKAKGKAK